VPETPLDPMTLPANLPVPVDDGAADHLRNSRVPDVALPATDGRQISLALIDRGRVVVYAYPRTGRPGESPLVDDWDLIPGARGCTPETCGFRDHHAEMRAAGAEVFGLSTQDTAYQQELVERLHLPFAILSDAELRLTRAWRLPTFEAAGQTLLRRLTIVIRDGRVEHVWYPVFPPDRHAEEVLDWLRANSAPTSPAG
jgi:peroxiredoxin